MPAVHVIQRHAHLAGAVKLDQVPGHEGPIARAVFTAISNVRRAAREGQDRDEETTVIQWTCWGRAAEHAAQYLGRGSHVNVLGHVRNNNHPGADGGTVFALAFTADEIDYLDTRAEAEARRGRQAFVAEMNAAEAQQRSRR